MSTGQSTNSSHTVSTPAQIADRVGELLNEIGWRPIADAQWQKLEAHLPQLRELLADDLEVQK